MAYDAPGAIDQEQHERCVIITPSYCSDHDLAASLCASIDEFFKFEYEHILVVPKRDLRFFQHLSGPHRRVITKESVLKPYGFHFLPFPRKIAIPGIFSRRFKEQWFHRKAGRISGWSVQQIVKLAANQICNTEIIVFIDSDVEFIRNVHFSNFVENGLTRLHEHSAGATLPSHQHWRKVARDLIGVDANLDSGMNYIGHMIAWRRETLAQLQRRIEAVNHRSWWIKLAQVKNFSEYILYGAFVQSGEGKDAHSLGDLALIHSLWISGDDDVVKFMDGISNNHIALHIQSTLPMSTANRHEKIRKLKNFATKSGRE